MTYTITRPVMTADELRQHKLGVHGRNFLRSDDGYDDMALNEGQGWTSMAAWGADGWDLGDWPYVVISTRQHDGKHQLLSVCEGDHTYYQFDSEADLHAALDYLFLWYMAGKDPERYPPSIGWENRERLDRGEITVDERFRGPYRPREER